MEAAVRKPNFFIVGAPKCGTTSMYAYLKAHPEVFMPERVTVTGIGEMHFFGSDLDFRRRPRMSLDEYVSYFRDAGEATAVGEKSVWYLRSEKAKYEIKEFDPKAKIIIMLRSPVDVLYALHRQLVYQGSEDIISFEAALAAEPERKRGERIPPRASPTQSLFYREIVAFSEQVEGYLREFGEDQVFIITFDDIQRDIPEVYGRLLRFLEVDHSFVPQFAVVNPSRRALSTAVRDLVVAPPSFLRKVGRVVLPRRTLRLRFRRAVLAANTRYEKRPPMHPELRHRLQQEMRPEVERLSRLLGRDLMHWVEG
jgi:hypothetical protein